jgi:putative transcriptional regulator
MSDADVDSAALSDPDNLPMSEEQLAKAPRMSRVKIIRRALSLTQEEFSARYQIPLGTLRDWEQGRSEPDQPARAYLKVIAADPERTAKALQRGAA